MLSARKGNQLIFWCVLNYQQWRHKKATSVTARGTLRRDIFFTKTPVGPQNHLAWLWGTKG